jgi:MipA family protein
MNRISQTLVRLALIAVPVAAFSQESSTPPEKWAIGPSAAFIDSPYAGEGTRVRVFPQFGYNGERMFLRGLSGGVHAYSTDRFTLDAMLSLRLYGFDISDLGRTELLTNGLDANLLSDRDDGLDAGLRATYHTEYGAIGLEGKHDISAASEGYEISLDYSRTWQFERTAITATAGANWLSSKLTDYYFGILDEEVARGVADYSPGSAVVPRVGLTAIHRIGSSKWQFLGAIEYQFLPEELRESTLLEPDSNGIGRVVLGLQRRF